MHVCAIWAQLIYLVTATCPKGMLSCRSRSLHVRRKKKKTVDRELDDGGGGETRRSVLLAALLVGTAGGAACGRLVAIILVSCQVL